MYVRWRPGGSGLLSNRRHRGNSVGAYLWARHRHENGKDRPRNREIVAERRHSADRLKDCFQQNFIPPNAKSLRSIPHGPALMTITHQPSAIRTWTKNQIRST